MRSTRATAAVERLKVRSGNNDYSMVLTKDALFYLVLNSASGTSTRLCEPLAMDAFVDLVNQFGPQTPRRITKSDAAFEKQLVKKNTTS